MILPYRVVCFRFSVVLVLPTLYGASGSMNTEEIKQYVILHQANMRMLTIGFDISS